LQERIPSAKTPIGRRRAKLVAGSLAMTMAAFGTVAAVTALPAYADATSADYTIGTPTGGVSGVAVTPSAVTASGAEQGYAVTFTATSALAATTGSVTVTPSTIGAGGATIEIASYDIIDTTSGCLQNTGGAATTPAGGITITLGATCTVNVGDKVEVDFDAITSGTGSFTYGVTTSANSTSQASNTVTVTSAPPAVSASTLVGGAPATYTISGSTVAGLGVGATTTSLKLTSAGTGPIVWFPSSSGAGYTVSVTPSGGVATSDTVTAAAVVAPSVTLTLGTAITNGDMLTITATGTNGTSGMTSTVTVTPAGGTAVGPSAALTFGTSSITAAPTVTVSPTYAGVSATYTVGFTAKTAVPNAGHITLAETTGPTVFSSETGILVTDTTQGWHFVLPAAPAVGSATFLPAGTVTIPLDSTADVINAGDAITITLVGVTNPATATVSDFDVSTSADTVPLAAAAYTIGTSVSTGVTVTASPNTTGSLATYTISNLKATAAVTGPFSVILTGPAGTVFPDTDTYYTLTDSTTSTGTSTATAAVYGVTTNIVTVTFPSSLVSGDTLSLTVQDAINPPTASGTDTITVANASIAAPAAVAPTFPDANVSYPSGAIVNFSGTFFVFAGGHAFGVPTPTVAAGVTNVDKATVLTSASGAVVPTATAAIGTQIIVYNNPTIYVVGTDGELHGFATPAQYLSDGYDGADAITVPNLGGITVGSTAGVEGAAATALATSSNGAIADSSGTYYVFAGGKAFGIPTPTTLTAILAGDTATPLTGTVTAVQTGASVLNGTVVTLGGAVSVAFNGAWYGFKSPAQLTADGYGGTPSILVPNAGGLTAITTYTGS
jgi:hypothetical protein